MLILNREKLTISVCVLLILSHLSENDLFTSKDILVKNWFIHKINLNVSIDLNL